MGVQCTLLADLLEGCFSADPFDLIKTCTNESPIESASRFPLTYLYGCLEKCAYHRGCHNMRRNIQMWVTFFFASWAGLSIISLYAPILTPRVDLLLLLILTPTRLGVPSLTAPMWTKTNHLVFLPGPQTLLPRSANSFLCHKTLLRQSAIHLSTPKCRMYPVALQQYAS